MTAEKEPGEDTTETVRYNIEHVSTDMINSSVHDGGQCNGELEDGDEEEGKKETD